MNKEHINEILFNFWDPIGINIEGWPDEYITYAKKIENMIHNGSASENEIAEYLYNVAINSIGVSVDKGHCINISKMILNDKNKDFSNI